MQIAAFIFTTITVRLSVPPTILSATAGNVSNLRLKLRLACEAEQSLVNKNFVRVCNIKYRSSGTVT